MTANDDSYYMRLALSISRQALPLCLPNPPVGCVIVENDVIVSTGYTHPPGEPHAEAHALNQIEGTLRGATVYVTLEPCSFVGLTPACAVTLVSRKVERVVIGLIDPDPRNQGKGVEILRNAGISVSIGILSEEVNSFIGPYLNS